MANVHAAENDASIYATYRKRSRTPRSYMPSALGKASTMRGQ